LKTLEAALDAELNVQVTVSPCLPYSGVKTFGELLLRHSKQLIVDVSPYSYRSVAVVTRGKPAYPGWENWLPEDSALSLYEWLHERIGDRAGWSQAGFSSLADR